VSAHDLVIVACVWGGVHCIGYGQIDLVDFGVRGEGNEGRFNRAVEREMGIRN